jgi:hypothetical protein
MNSRSLVLFAACVGLILALCSFVQANPSPDPCLVAYPDGPCTYHYGLDKYYTVGPGDPLYNPTYDRGGSELLQIGTNSVDLSIYQAPHLTGFVPAYDGNEGFFFEGTDLNVIIDGFSHVPTTYANILVVFDQVVPTGCTPEIYVNGSKLTNMVYSAGDLVVHTPTAEGHNYSDVFSIHVNWHGCYGLHVWAFSDANYNNVKDGGECFTAFSHDVCIPVEPTTSIVISSKP